jgi:hypothetical protein
MSSQRLSGFSSCQATKGALFWPDQAAVSAFATLTSSGAAT